MLSPHEYVVVEVPVPYSHWASRKEYSQPSEHFQYAVRLIYREKLGCLAGKLSPPGDLGSFATGSGSTYHIPAAIGFRIARHHPSYCA